LAGETFRLSDNCFGTKGPSQGRTKEDGKKGKRKVSRKENPRNGKDHRKVIWLGVRRLEKDEVGKPIAKRGEKKRGSENKWKQKSQKQQLPN